MRVVKFGILAAATASVASFAFADGQKYKGTVDGNNKVRQLISVEAGKEYEVKFKADERHLDYHLNVIRSVTSPNGRGIFRSVAQEEADDGKATLHFTPDAVSNTVRWLVEVKNNSNRASKYELKVEKK